MGLAASLLAFLLPVLMVPGEEPKGSAVPATLAVPFAALVVLRPRGKIPVPLGTASTGSGKFRAGITAGVEILLLAVVARQGAAVTGSRSLPGQAPVVRAERG